MKSDLKNEVSCLNYEKSTVQQEKNCLNESYEELNKGNNFFWIYVYFRIFMYLQFDFVSKI